MKSATEVAPLPTTHLLPPSDIASCFRSLPCRGPRRAVSAARPRPGRTPERYP
jgi:hypothetical protein